MKTNRLLTAFAVTILATSLLSCTKENTFSTASAEDETTFELSGNQAVADNLTEDANNIFMEAAANRNLLGSNFGSLPVITSNTLTCATLTVTPASGFPKTIVIDFGTAGCTSVNNIIRKGKINITLSDSVRRTGSQAIITFSNYAVNNFKKEGTITWKNTSTSITKSWQRKVENGRVTAPNGRYWLHNGARDVVQIAGTSTPNTLLDDIFLITGNYTITNAAGKTRDCFITEALQKKSTCDNIGTGKLKVQGAAHNALINFGDGDCDKLATISIDGQEPRTIVLR
jgi:hypothetical protein